MEQRAMCPRCHRRFGSSKLFSFLRVGVVVDGEGGRCGWMESVWLKSRKVCERHTFGSALLPIRESTVCEDKCALDPSSTRRSNSRIWDVCEMCAVQIFHPAILCAVAFDSIPNMYSPCQAPTRTYRIYILGSTLGLWCGGMESNDERRQAWQADGVGARNRTSNDERKIVERREIINKRNLYPSRSFHFFFLFPSCASVFRHFFPLFRSSAELHTLLLAFWEI